MHPFGSNIIQVTLPNFMPLVTKHSKTERIRTTLMLLKSPKHGAYCTLLSVWQHLTSTIYYLQLFLAATIWIHESSSFMTVEVTSVAYNKIIIFSSFNTAISYPFKKSLFLSLLLWLFQLYHFYAVDTSNKGSNMKILYAELK